MSSLCPGELNFWLRWASDVPSIIKVLRTITSLIHLLSRSKAEVGFMLGTIIVRRETKKQVELTLQLLL